MMCAAWNDEHDCGLTDDHPGDHECYCGDVWNRGPWDDDADEWAWQRPDRRCISEHRTVIAVETAACATCGLVVGRRLPDESDVEWNGRAAGLSSLHIVRTSPDLPTVFVPVQSDATKAS